MKAKAFLASRLLLAFFSLVAAISPPANASDVGTVFGTNGFVCGSSDPNYWAGGQTIDWKEYIIQTYRNHWINLGRCPDYYGSANGWVFWQQETMFWKYTKELFRETFNSVIESEAARMGGADAYRRVFNDVCLQNAKSQYGHWVIGAEYIPYSGNQCRITVVIPNSTPTANNLSVSMDEDTTRSFSLSAYDSDGYITGYTVTSYPSVGSYYVSGGTVTYTPPANWSGTVSLSYYATDNRNGRSNTGTLSITVNPVNDPPVAQDKQAYLQEDGSGSAVGTAYDIDSPTPTEFRISEHAKFGVSSIQGSTVSYKPNPNWNGTDTVKYQAKDSSGAWSSPATMRFTVSPVNDPPSVDDRHMTTSEDVAGLMTLTANDVDKLYEGDNHRWEIVTHPDPSTGEAKIIGSTLRFTPSKHWNGSTSLTYRAFDKENVVSNIATVTINVTPVNDIPEVEPVIVSIPEDTIAEIDLTLIDPDLDFEGDSHSYEVEGVLPESEGTYTHENGKLVVTPAQDWNGTIYLSYKVKDSHGAYSLPGNIAVEVTYVNDAPTSTGADIKTREGMESDHVMPWVKDPDIIYGDRHTFEVAEQPANGKAKFVGDFLEYTPSEGFVGEETFKIRAIDREGASVEGDVNVTVEKFNYRPMDIIPREIIVYAGFGGSAELRAIDKNSWGSHIFEVVRQPDHGEVSINGSLLVYRTAGKDDTSVLVKAVDQDGLSVTKEIRLVFRSASDFFEGREVIKIEHEPKIPAIQAQLKDRMGAYALKISDSEVVAALGREIIAYVPEDSDMGLSVGDASLREGEAAKLTIRKSSSAYLEAKLGAIEVGFAGKGLVYLSRFDGQGPVYAVAVDVWSPKGGLTSDKWSMPAVIGRSRVEFSQSNGACTVITNESSAKVKNAIDEPTCFLSWDEMPGESRDVSELNRLKMEAMSSTPGKESVSARAFVFDSEGNRHEIAKFSGELEATDSEGAISFAIRPNRTEAHQKVENLSLSLVQKQGDTCVPTVDPAIAQKSAAQWQSQLYCLITWTAIPNGLKQQTRDSMPVLEGILDLAGENLIGWKQSVYTPKGALVEIGSGEHRIEGIAPPPVEIELPTTNLVKDNMYWVSQSGGIVGQTITHAIPATILQQAYRDGVKISEQEYPSYGRDARITHFVEGAFAPLWSLTPYKVSAGYSLLAGSATEREMELLAVPRDSIVPVIKNGEDFILDTESLTVQVQIQDFKNPEDGYDVLDMGDWDVRLLMAHSGSGYLPITGWEPINAAGEVAFEIGLETLTNKAVRIIAEAKVRSPVPEYVLHRESPTPLVLSVLNGNPLDGSIQALRIIGPAPLRSTFFAVTNDRYQTRDLGGVRWEMSSDGGTTWEEVSTNKNLPQRLTWIFQRGSYLLRAELTNKHSGAKSWTPTIEIIAYVVPAARLKGPANVFIGDSGRFSLTDIAGNDLDTTGMIVEWSEDRGQTWTKGGREYSVARDFADRVYLMVRLKYEDSPEDKRVYRVLRAGVAFRPVRPPRVQIIGPRRPEVGKEATWIANLMMPYPRMDLTMDGEFIMPTGEVVKSLEVKYTPTQEDMDKEESYIAVNSWINGFKDKGGSGITQHRLIFWQYDWPSWTINNKFTAQYTPAELTMTARSLGLFREFEGLKMEWDIPPYPGMTVLKDTSSTSRVLQVTEPGTYEFGVHISDNRGHYSYVDTQLEFKEPIPWNVELSWSGDNPANRAPLGVLIRPTITGGHPKDRINIRQYTVDGEPLEAAGEYARATLPAPGTYTAKLDIASEMGHSASGEVRIPVNTNKSPSCTLEVSSGRTSWLAKASCSDEDGRIAKYLWFVNGEPQAISSSSISVPMWRHPDAEPVITVVGVDDSGAESPPVANK